MPLLFFVRGLFKYGFRIVRNPGELLKAARPCTKTTPLYFQPPLTATLMRDG